MNASARKEREAIFEQVMQRADAAGRAAADSKVPVPMVVAEHDNPFNDSSRVNRRWYVEGGVCGFAWVKIFPGTSPFAKWLVNNHPDNASKGYYGGIEFRPSGSFYGQSMEKKESYCEAFAEVLQRVGIKAYCDSRMD